jgi:hypothetical protein
VVKLEVELAQVTVSTPSDGIEVTSKNESASWRPDRNRDRCELPQVTATPPEPKAG